MIKEAIKKLVAGNDLTFDEAAQVMDEMFSGTATQSQMAAYLTALRIKGETIDEITASAQVMREKALHIKPNRDVLDIVGTGGDGTGTFNISTTAAFIIAAAGIPVAKHGNRSMSSKSGSADCLEQLGININITPEKSEEVLNKAGICFMFAQGYHSSMKYVGPVRKEIGIRNIFNVLGPLTNPAGADLQVTGVYSEALVEPIAQVFSNLGVKKGYVFYGMDGMDEVTLTTTTKVCEIDNGKFNTFILNPEDYGLKLCAPEDLAGGDGKENAEITKEILSGEIKDAKRDIVVLNAALGLCTGGKADSIQDGIKLANEIIDSGKAVKDLNQFDLSNLRWSKVVICTDGDVDGFQIRTLILTMLYRLCPTLIREGYVYIAETPLFEITCKEKSGEKTWFAYSEKEKADILKKLEGKKVNVQRSKGLGENDPEMMWMTTMSPETRRLIRVLPEDAEETARVFDLLLGDNLSGRKDYIAENGYKYLDMIDVS